MQVTNDYFESSKQVIILKESCKGEDGLYTFYYNGALNKIDNRTLVFQSSNLSIPEILIQFDLDEIESLHIQDCKNN